MITPLRTDLGPRLPASGPGSRYGVISAIYTRGAFVWFDHQHHSRAVNPAYLDFANRPPKLAKPTFGEQIGTVPGKADARQGR